MYLYHHHDIFGNDIYRLNLNGGLERGIGDQEYLQVSWKTLDVPYILMPTPK